jgi:hypothetical protein
MFDLESMHQRQLELIRRSRQHNQAAAIGVCVLAIAGGLWATTGVVGLGRRSMLPFALIAAITLILAAGGLIGLRRTRTLPIIGMVLRGALRKAALMTAILTGTLMLSSLLLLQHHAVGIVSIVDALLAGSTFLILAQVLALPLYQQAGLWLYALGLNTWAFVPQWVGADGVVALWPIVVGLGGAAILWITAVWSLWRLAVRLSITAPR